MSPERTFVEKRYRFLIIVSSRHESKAPEEPASQPPLTRGHRRPPPCAGSHSPEGEKGRESGGVGWGSWATAQGGAFAPAAGPNWSGSSPRCSPRRVPRSRPCPSLAAEKGQGEEVEEEGEVGNAGEGSSSTAPSCSPRTGPSHQPPWRARPRSSSATAASWPAWCLRGNEPQRHCSDFPAWFSLWVVWLCNAVPNGCIFVSVPPGSRLMLPGAPWKDLIMQHLWQFLCAALVLWLFMLYHGGRRSGFRLQL